MPPARPLRRAATNENDENAATTRITRAKTAALDTVAGDPPKKTVLAATRRAATTTTLGTSQAVKRRAALGDVSNVNKEPVVTKGNLSKAQKPVGVTKLARTSSRPALSSKSANQTASDLKRPSSGSGAAGNAPKRRITSGSKASVEDEDTENSAAPISAVTKDQILPSSKEIAPIAAAPTLDYGFEEGITAQMRRQARDLDAEDFHDPCMMAEYVHEIFDYMRKLEIATLPNPNYMDIQEELEWKMRGILIDWLLEVHSRFRLLPETLFLTVNIIDRFLSQKTVNLDRLQLVGVTAMFIASKYEEVLSPHVQNFKHVADDGFTESEILSAERYILSTLNYDLSYPNPMNFLRRCSKADDYDIHTRTLGKYLLEIGCLDHRFIKYPPSHVAAGAMYLARLVLDRGPWDATLAVYSGYTEEQIMPVFELMVNYLRSPIVHEAFFRKYASKKFLRASINLRDWAKKFAQKQLDEEDVGAGESDTESQS